MKRFSVWLAPSFLLLAACGGQDDGEPHDEEGGTDAMSASTPEAGVSDGGAAAESGPTGQDPTTQDAREAAAAPAAKSPGKLAAPAKDLCGSETLSGALETSDPVFTRAAGTTCTYSPVKNGYPYDAYELHLKGPGPHEIVADTCMTPGFDAMITVYQTGTGVGIPFDTTEVCPTGAVASADGNANTCGNTDYPARLRVTNLKEGAIWVVLHTFSPNVYSDYKLTVQSSTSKCMR